MRNTRDFFRFAVRNRRVRIIRDYNVPVINLPVTFRKIRKSTVKCKIRKTEKTKRRRLAWKRTGRRPIDRRMRLNFPIKATRQRATLFSREFSLLRRLSYLKKSKKRKYKQRITKKHLPILNKENLVRSVYGDQYNVKKQVESKHFIIKKFANRAAKINYLLKKYINQHKNINEQFEYNKLRNLHTNYMSWQVLSICLINMY
jgi:hypothetical protein